MLADRRKHFILKAVASPGILDILKSPCQHRNLLIFKDMIAVYEAHVQIRIYTAYFLDFYNDSPIHRGISSPCHKSYLCGQDGRHG
jgi:hypothetical protein